MKELLAFLFLGSVFLSAQAGPATHSACNNPFWDYSAQSPDELRKIAETCDSDQISNLYFSRAYHIELLNEYKALAALKAYKKSNDQMYIERQRMFIALSEAFAYDKWKNGNDAVLSNLIDHYDQAIEVTEYLLWGNEVLARNSFSKP